MTAPGPDLTREAKFLLWLCERSDDLVVELGTHEEREALLAEYGKVLEQEREQMYARIITNPTG